MKRDFLSHCPKILAGLLMLTLGCHEKAAPPGKTGKSDALPVSVTSVQTVAWDKTVSIIGTLYPKDEATLAGQVEGAVEKTLVDFGDRVKAGQVLALIDTASYDAQLQQAAGNLAKAEANWTNARRNLERLIKLRQTGIASESDLDQAEAQASQWEAEVKAAKGAEAVARLNLEKSRVQAPFDGAISTRIVGKGDFTKIGSPLFNMVNDSVLKFIFQVPEKFASYVQKGLPVSFSVDNYPKEVFTGTVYLISPSVHTSSRSFGVGALVTNSNFRLKASTFARGTLVLEKAVTTTAVPVDAVVNFAGVTKVFVIEQNVARSRVVTTGRVRDGLQELTQGVKPGEWVAVSGNSRLSDGATVKVQGAKSESKGAMAAPKARS